MNDEFRTLCEQVKITCEYLSERPDKVGRDAEWDRQASHWKIKLRLGKRSLTTYYSQGSAHTGEPDTAHVMSALISDADCGQYDFEEFCADLGYDSDSIKARNTWQACKSMHQKLNQFLGEKFEEFANLAREF
jgi:hypothetical protein